VLGGRGAAGSGAPLTFELSSDQGVVVLNACQSGAVGKQLTALSLFQNVTDLNVLSRLQDLDVPQRFHGQTVDDWAQALDEAAGAELLSPVGNVMYRIHPALPA